MGRQWQGVAWSRTLPRPVRNGRFYRLGHSVAVILAGHAHQDGGGITVSVKTVAEEAWCTLAEAQEAVAWLLDEGWFTASAGPKGTEFACNLTVVRQAGSEVEDRAAHRRAQMAKNSREYRLRKKVMTEPDDAVMTVSDDAGSSAIGVRHHRHQTSSSTSSGSVIKSDDGSDDTRRSEACKTLKTLEDKREDPKPRSTADASDAPAGLFAVEAVEEPPPAEKKARPPANQLADLYHDALEGNVNYKAVLMVIRGSLKKNPYEDVERGVRVLAGMPEKPVTNQTLYSAIKGRLGTNGYRPFRNSEMDYANHGGFGEFPAEYPDNPFDAAA